MKSAEGIVTRNPSYQGAPEADVAHGSNWFHFRVKQIKKPSVQQLAHIDPAIGERIWILTRVSARFKIWFCLENFFLNF